MLGKLSKLNKLSKLSKLSGAAMQRLKSGRRRHAAVEPADYGQWSEKLIQQYMTIFLDTFCISADFPGVMRVGTEWFLWHVIQ